MQLQLQLPRPNPPQLQQNLLKRRLMVRPAQNVVTERQRATSGPLYGSSFTGWKPSGTRSSSSHTVAFPLNIDGFSMLCFSRWARVARASERFSARCSGILYEVARPTRNTLFGMKRKRRWNWLRGYTYSSVYSALATCVGSEFRIR